VLIVAFLSPFPLLLSRCSAADISLLFPLLSRCYPAVLGAPASAKGQRSQMLDRTARSPARLMELRRRRRSVSWPTRVERAERPLSSRGGILDHCIVASRFPLNT
jgi:hypothetical protein